MADIFIKSNDEDVTFEFTFSSPQLFFYTITIVDKSDDSEIFRGKGSSDGITLFPLGKANKLVNKGFSIYWTISDPAGAGNNYNAEAVAKQNSVACSEPQRCSGTTTRNQSFASNIGTFINREN